MNDDGTMLHRRITQASAYPRRWSSGNAMTDLRSTDGFPQSRMKYSVSVGKVMFIQAKARTNQRLSRELCAFA
jgi:hypothetical protein